MTPAASWLESCVSAREVSNRGPVGRPAAARGCGANLNLFLTDCACNLDCMHWFLTFQLSRQHDAIALAMPLALATLSPTLTLLRSNVRVGERVASARGIARAMASCCRLSWNVKNQCMQSKLQAQSVRNKFKLAPQPRAAAGRPTGPRFDTSRAETQLSSQEAAGVMPGWILGLKVVN